MIDLSRLRSEQHLAALDDVLNLVAAAQRLALLAQLVGGGFIDRRAVGAGAGFLGTVVAIVPIAIVFGLFGTIVGAVILMVDVDRVIILGFGAKPFFLGGVLGLLAEQRLAVGLRDLVVIRVDFRKGEETVPVSAVIDEGRLQ